MKKSILIFVLVLSIILSLPCTSAFAGTLTYGDEKNKLSFFGMKADEDYILDAMFSDFSKIVFCLNMLVGRLEIFPFLVLFSPDLWRRKF